MHTRYKQKLGLLQSTKISAIGAITVTLRQEQTGPTVGCLKRLERLGRSWEQICSVCSAALEAFGAASSLLAPIQHVKSEEVGCRTSEPLNSLTGGVLANQLVFMFWSTGMRLAVIVSIQDEFICVHLVMPRCMFSMQLFLSEIRFDRK